MPAKKKPIVTKKTINPEKKAIKPKKEKVAMAINLTKEQKEFFTSRSVVFELSQRDNSQCPVVTRGVDDKFKDEPEVFLTSHLWSHVIPQSNLESEKHEEILKLMKDVILSTEAFYTKHNEKDLLVVMDGIQKMEKILPNWMSMVK